MSGVTPPSPWTIVVRGSTGQEVSRTAMRAGVPVTIGRSPDCTIMLGTMTVARNHGRIELVNGLPTYFDEPGAAGTRLDGDPVEGTASLGERTELEIGGFRFNLLRVRAVAASAPASARPVAAGRPAADAGATLLDRHIQGVRTHRSETRKDTQARSVRWEQDWKEVIAQARQIGAKYGRHPQILEFSVTKDGREVHIKLKEDSRRGYAYFMLSRAHPEGRYPEMEAVWLRELGRDDAHFSEPLKGLEELISRIAPRLA